MEDEIMRLMRGMRNRNNNPDLAAQLREEVDLLLGEEDIPIRPALTIAKKVFHQEKLRPANFIHEGKKVSIGAQSLENYLKPDPQIETLRFFTC